MIKLDILATQFKDHCRQEEKNTANMIQMYKSLRKSRRKPYTKGQLNSLIDAVLHPLYSDCGSLRLLDGVLHGVVEGNAELSAKKFLRYNLPSIMAKSGRKRKRKKEIAQ